MTRKIRFYYLCVATLLLASSCARVNKTPQDHNGNKTAQSSTTADITQASPRDKVDFQILASHENLSGTVWSGGIVHMGWVDNGQIFFGVGNPFSYNSNLVENTKQLNWYLYDPIQFFTKSVNKDQVPFYGVTPATSRMLPVNGALSYVSSPDKTNFLYTKLPDTYKKPSEDETPLDYVEPVELWASQYNAKEKFPLLTGKENWYMCGSSLSPESKWSANNTLVFGTCTGNYQNYFLADLKNKSVQLLNLYLDEEYFPVESISIANETPSLALISEDSHQLWIIPARPGQREINTNLTQSNLLFPGTTSSPVWSSDDQWIYYWAFDKSTGMSSGTLQEYQYWWLEKINITTAERRVVLSKENLLSFINKDMYQLSPPLGSGNIWRLSPDEKKILLFLNETGKSPATLFMISIE
jgi:hypothetical protein